MSTVRTRTNGGYRPILIYEDRINTTCAETNWVFNVNVGNVFNGERRVMNDVLTDRFAARKAKGEIIINPMDLSVVAVNQVAGRGYILNGVPISCSGSSRTPAWRSNEYFHSWFYPRVTDPVLGVTLPIIKDGFSSSDVSNFVTQACTSLLSKRGSGGTWESAAEIEQSLAMFSRPIQRYANFLSKIEPVVRKKRVLLKTTEGLMGLWMQYRYGVLPLIRDIQNAADNFRKTLGKVRETSRGNAHALNTIIENSTSTIGVLKGSYSNKITESVSVRAFSLDEWERDALNQFGLTSKDFLMLPWELTNASFAVDWLVNIGDFLGATLPNVGWNSLGAGYTVTRAVSNTYSLTGTVSTSSSYTLQVSPSGQTGCTKLTKYRVQGLSDPGLVIKSDFKFDQFTRAADAVSLLTQKTRSLFLPTRKGII